MTVRQSAGLFLQGGPRRIDLLLSRLDEPLIIAFVLGIVFGLFLLAVESVTLVYVWARARREKRRESRRPAVRDGIINRLVEGDPDWASWVSDVDEVERELIREQVDAFLRKLDGQERDSLQAAGHALDIPSEATAAVREGSRLERLIGLKWLTVLEHPVDSAFVVEHCQRDPKTRAAAARLLYETGHPDAASIGTELLLSEPDRPMTSFGVDTLYRLHEGDPTVLFEYGSEHVESWSNTVTLQVLLVIHEFTMVPRDAPLTWLVELFDHDAPKIRAATAKAFVRYGWREHIREAVPWSELISDPSPLVRRAACEMLGSWSDEAGIWELKSIATTDEDTRVRVAAARELLARRDEGDDAEWLPDGELDTALQWVLNERAIASQRTA